MDRQQKAAVIDEVADLISNAGAVFAVEYRGLSVPQAATLRAALRDSDTTFRVVKNTLSQRAAERAGADSLSDALQGPTAFAFVGGDAAAAARTIADFGRRSGGAVAFKAGFMDGNALTADQVVAISRLPSREVLYGQFVGVVAAPITGLVRALNALIAGLAIQLKQIHDENLVPRAGGGAAAGDGSPPPAEAQDPVGSDADAEPKDVPAPGPAPDPAPDEPAAPGGDEPSTNQTASAG